MPTFPFGLLRILLPLMLFTAGCDTQLSLNECEAAPSIAADNDYVNLEVGRAIVEGPDGRILLAARVDTLQNSGNRFIALGVEAGQVPRVTHSSAAIDLLSLSVGDERTVSAFYNVDGSSQGGPRLLRVTRVTATEISGLFSGCVRAENRAIPISGPSQIVRGGFTVSTD